MSSTLDIPAHSAARAAVLDHLRLLAKWLFFPGFDVATRKRLALCRHFLSGDISTLDAGCGNGAFSLAAYRRGNRVLGVSFNEDEVRRCREYAEFLGVDQARCRFRPHNLYDLTSLGERFDQIFCFETLEHLARDQEVLALFARLLNPGGVIHLCTPRLDRKPYYGEVISPVEDGGHVRLGYTPELFREILEAEGFEVVTQEDVVGPVSQAVMNFGRWLFARPLGFLPTVWRDAVSGAVVLLLLPLTWLDRLRPRGRGLCIYVQARLSAALPAVAR